MMILSNNIVELAKATWNLFCLYPGYCIIMTIIVILAGIFTYHLVKEIFTRKWRDPIILR